MNRGAFLAALGSLVAPLVAGAEPARTVYRVGYLSSGPSASNLFVEPFRQGLRAHGWPSSTHSWRRHTQTGLSSSAWREQGCASEKR